jgi:hypothetical protein
MAHEAFIMLFDPSSDEQDQLRCHHGNATTKPQQN